MVTVSRKTTGKKIASINSSDNGSGLPLILGVGVGVGVFHQLLLLGEPGGSWVAPLSTCEEEGWSKGSMEGLESDPKVGEGISEGGSEQFFILEY